MPSYQWSHDYQHGADYTGNESQPETQDSLYVHKALIIIPKQNKKNNNKEEQVEHNKQAASINKATLSTVKDKKQPLLLLSQEGTLKKRLSCKTK